MHWCDVPLVHFPVRCIQILLAPRTDHILTVQLNLPINSEIFHAFLFHAKRLPDTLVMFCLNSLLGVL